MSNQDLLVGHASTASGDGRKTLRKYALDGTLKWSASHGQGSVAGTVYAIAVDSDGNIYAGGSAVTVSSVTSAIRKYSSDGTEITSGWPINTADSQTVRGLATDSNKDVLIATERLSSSSRSQSKRLADGSLSWEKNFTRNYYGVACSGTDSYFAGDSNGTFSCVKYDSGGTQQWVYNQGDGHAAIALDSSYVYLGGAFSTIDFYNTRKLAKSNGALQWSKNLHPGTRINSIKVDGSGNIYVAGNLSSSTLTTRKYDSSGTLVWEKNHGATVNAVVVDDDGYVYTAGTRTSNITLRKYAPDGTEITSGWPIDTGANSYALALITIPPITTTPPGLPVGLSLGVPLATAITPLPPLAAWLRLGVPSAEPQAPPLGDGQKIYRVYWSDGSSITELPITGFQCRRRRDDSTWLSITVAAPATAIGNALMTSAGDTVTLYAGLRAMNGTESKGQMTYGVIESADWTREVRGGGVTLNCRSNAVAETAQTRVLTGIARQFSDAGRRGFECIDVDPQLRPGDTVTDGVTSFIAGTVEYRVDVRGGSMTVTEDG